MDATDGLRESCEEDRALCGVLISCLPHTDLLAHDGEGQALQQRPGDRKDAHQLHGQRQLCGLRA